VDIPDEIWIGTSHLATSRSARARFLFSCLPAIRPNWLSPPELTAQRKAEELRQRLLASEAEISSIDYGAGSPDQNLTAEEMARGRCRDERVGDICRARSKEIAEATFLFKLIRHFHPVRCLELGTCLGITAAYIGLGLQLNGGGHLVSIEGCPRLAAIATENMRSVGLTNVSVYIGRFHDVLPNLLSTMIFDFAWIDGHHDYDATLSYFGQIASRGAEDTAIVLDDIAWSAGMKSAWNAIRKSPMVKACATVRGFGICFTSPHS
jgi:predicted O-methyltransferase YrrM